MTVIKFTKRNKQMLKDYSDGSFDKIVTQLLDEVEEHLPVVDVDYSVMSTIEIKDDTLERVEAYRLTEGESYENIILRMLMTAKTLNTTSD